MVVTHRRRRPVESRPAHGAAPIGWMRRADIAACRAVLDLFLAEVPEAPTFSKVLWAWAARAGGPFHGTIRSLAAELRIVPSSVVSSVFRSGLASPYALHRSVALIRLRSLLTHPAVSVPACAGYFEASSAQSIGRTVRALTGRTVRAWECATTAEELLATLRDLVRNERDLWRTLRGPHTWLRRSIAIRVPFADHLVSEARGVVTPADMVEV